MYFVGCVNYQVLEVPTIARNIVEWHIKILFVVVTCSLSVVARKIFCIPEAVCVLLHRSLIQRSPFRR